MCELTRNAPEMMAISACPIEDYKLNQKAVMPYYRVETYLRGCLPLKAAMQVYTKIRK